MYCRRYYQNAMQVALERDDWSCFQTEESMYYQENGEVRKREENLLREHHFHIFLNGTPYAVLVCTPMQLTALVVGHLATSCIIADVSDIKKIEYNEDNSNCQVWLWKENVAEYIDKEWITSSENNQKIYEALKVPEVRENTFVWKPEWITAMAEMFRKDTELHASTHGTHSCFLGRGGKILYVCEDIGRHNALDKAVGMGMLNGIALSDCMIYISGRVPLDMLGKIIRTRIPLIASNTVPTSQSVALAKQKNITLIGKARPNGFIIYADGRKDG
ncbi:formate dehydrogenase accessory sulfurtransferase FdhD [[Clostridium] polysaccharolyticum]|uniref:FdhD protein n=1 Tax=[Clostridium] polysaccharolyticum TaxID=29364 RepID=A0A1I0EEL4_9FIRM|nr:formate dehydrogenase accessory sulfurtransferase FdhD [[Clostridium] polysaccharolyticum]SET43606.1 FdhD protein [[Clostridium] polysaccharolyticum]